MALVGHWKTLVEAEKLSLTQLVSGIVEETVEVGGLLPLLGGAQVTGKSITWNRELSLPTGAFADIHEQLEWSADVDYTQKTTSLKRIYKQTILDKFVEETYGNYNNYKAIQLFETRKGVTRFLEDKIIYGDLTYTSSKEFDGLHALAAENTGTDLDIDEGDGALSLNNLRKMIDAMKYGVDVLLVPFELGRRFDAMAQEAGITSGPWSIVYGKGEIGQRVTFFDGIPIIRSDYLVAETNGTGEGTDARAKVVSGSTKYFSIFGIKFGDVMAQSPGLALAFGNTRSAGDVFRYEEFEKLEDFDAEGLRLVAYVALLLGSSKSLGRIYDITDGAITA